MLAMTSRRMLKRWWWLSALAAVVVWARLALLDRTLAMPGAEYGILSLQFVTTSAALTRIREIWVEAGVLPVALESLRTDFLFIAVYVGNFVIGCLLVTRAERWGRRMAGIALGIAAFDVAENLLQMRVLTVGASDGIAVFNTLCVTGKFLLVAVVATFLLRHWARQRRSSAVD